LRHRGITNNARFCAEILQAGPGEVWVNPLPLFHTAGCVLVTLGAVQGLLTQVVPPGFDPGLMLHLLESERGTLFVGVPTMLLAQLDHPDFPGRDLSSIRCAFSGGATVPPTLVCRCRIEGRLKEMIIRGGENIYSREIEQLLHTHPAVADVAIVGMPDDHCGEQVAAFVRPTPGFPSRKTNWRPSAAPN
jgi:acyl-CoA synthetase (AMP-forming)/AMP-acid ligase II